MKPNNQKGQLVVEAVLLMVVVVGVAMLVSKGFQRFEVVKNLTSTPWVRLQGMVECGVWEPCGISHRSPGKHPSTYPRLLSYDPNDNGG